MVLEANGGNQESTEDPVFIGMMEVAGEVFGIENFSSVSVDSRFKEDLNADSLDLVEAVMGLEEKFEVEISEEDLDGVLTIGGIFNVLKAKLSSKE